MRAITVSEDIVGDSSLDPDVRTAPTLTAVATVAVTGELPSATITPAPRSSPAPAASGVAFLTVVGGRPGQTANVTVQTAPNAACVISVVTPHGTVSVAQGLVPENAFATGQVGAWVIGTRTEAGTGMVAVTCNGVSATAEIGIG